MLYKRLSILEIEHTFYPDIGKTILLCFIHTKLENIKILARDMANVKGIVYSKHAKNGVMGILIATAIKIAL